MPRDRRLRLALDRGRADHRRLGAARRARAHGRGARGGLEVRPARLGRPRPRAARAIVFLYAAGTGAPRRRVRAPLHDTVVAAAPHLPHAPVRLAFLLARSASAPRSASSRCTPGCPTPTARRRARSPRCSRARCSATAFYAILRFFQVDRRRGRAAPSPGTCCSSSASSRSRSPRLFVLAPAELQAAARLLVDRAHGRDRDRDRLRRARSRSRGRCCTSSPTPPRRASRSSAPARSCAATTPSRSTASAARPPALPWSGPMFLAAVLALSGLPLSGIFRSEFQIVSRRLRASPRTSASRCSSSRSTSRSSGSLARGRGWC